MIGKGISTGKWFNDLRTVNLLLKEFDSTGFQLRNRADDDFAGLFASFLKFTAVTGDTIDTANTDNAIVTLKARDNGVGKIEIARMKGEANPYFGMGGNQELKVHASGAVIASLPTADPHVSGQLWAESGVVTVSSG